jgi:RNA polymerase sigma-70 factor (ECF subfamily)
MTQLRAQELEEFQIPKRFVDPRFLRLESVESLFQPCFLMMLCMDTGQEKLLAAAVNGDRAALQQLLLENYARLAESIRTRIPDQLRTVVDVEDILQTTFVHVFRGLSSFRDGDANSFYAWVRSIADARLTDAVRKATRQKRGGGWNRVAGEAANSSGSFLDLIHLLSNDQRSPSRSAASHEAVVALQIALAGLAEDQREAISLRHIENLTMKEVVERMGRTDAAIRGLLHRGKAALKKSLGNSSAWFSGIR